MEKEKCMRCGTSVPSDKIYRQVFMDDSDDYLICPDCYGDQLAARAIENTALTAIWLEYLEEKDVDILDELKKKLAEEKAPRLLRNEKLICLLQSAVNEIQILRSQINRLEEAVS